MELPIVFNDEDVAAFCKKHHIIKLALFGSILTDRFGPESDVDLLVEFDAGHVPGLMALVGMEEELSQQLGRKADLRTAQELSPSVREDILQNALTLYEE